MDFIKCSDLAKALLNADRTLNLTGWGFIVSLQALLLIDLLLPASGPIRSLNNPSSDVILAGDALVIFNNIASSDNLQLTALRIIDQSAACCPHLDLGNIDAFLLDTRTLGIPDAFVAIGAQPAAPSAPDPASSPSSPPTRHRRSRYP
ncbi:Anaphase-promoting complex subunit 11 [Fusarium oxysporum f. sp. albedinis]|nr:Anaphase-promoting complex subunit 11 [Fusarium oxysporum f. sp. albedinis]